MSRQICNACGRPQANDDDFAKGLCNPDYDPDDAMCWWGYWCNGSGAADPIPRPRLERWLAHELKRQLEATSDYDMAAAEGAAKALEKILHGLEPGDG